ncbi:hypothetical protein [Paenibacillus pabuli]|uniref:hypothetical protein n=1 Tax=Paenibacillus pabuli TaxID=1472 RepID=UPI003CFB529F
MALPQRLDKLPNWSRNQANRWADYIELSCIKNDKIISIHDIMDHYTDEEPEEVDRGTSGHSSKFDKIYSDFEVCFELIRFRTQTLGKNYPFILVDNSTIQLKQNLSKYNLFYIFLLLSSNLSFFDKSIGYKLTHAFEDISSHILEQLSSPYSITHVFGTSRSDFSNYSGNLRTRITTLAKDLSGVTTKIFDSDKMYDVPAGDGGLDLVSYFPIDNMPFIPISFGQCACSYDEWQDKQNSIKSDKWFTRIHNLAPYLQFSFLPFYVRRANGEFENTTVINTCVIDRHRIFKVAKNSVFKKFVRHPIYSIVEELVN